MTRQKLKKMSYAEIERLTGEQAEKACDALGLSTRGGDEQLRERLKNLKRGLPTEIRKDDFVSQV